MRGVRWNDGFGVFPKPTFEKDKNMIFTGVWRVFPEKGIAFNSHNGNAAYIQATPDGFVIWGINIPATWMLKELADWVAKNMTPNVDFSGSTPLYGGESAGK